MKYKIFGCLFLACLILTGCGKEADYSSCLINANGVCITKISKTPKGDGNYWTEAAKICSGAQNLPKAIDLTKIASYIYEGNPVIPADERKTELKANENFKLFDLYKNSSFSIFSEETEQAKQVAYIRSYYQSETSWDSIMSESGDSVITVCVDRNNY